MADQIAEILDRKSRHAIPGAEFVAAGLVASVVSFTPPGLQSLAENLEPLDSPCEFVTQASENEQTILQHHVDVKRFNSTPGITALEQNLQELISRDSSVVAHLKNLVESTTVPRSWSNDDVELPSNECKQYAVALLNRLHSDYAIIPFKVVVMKDGGLLASYKSRAKRTMRVEIDNDLDAIAVVTDGRDILSSAILEADDFEENTINVFQPPEMVAAIMS